jgi:hypothetical protein
LVCCTKKNLATLLPSWNGLQRRCKSQNVLTREHLLGSSPLRFLSKLQNFTLVQCWILHANLLHPESQREWE